MADFLAVLGTLAFVVVSFGLLIGRETNIAQFGFLGSDYIDVLQLNTACQN